MTELSRLRDAIRDLHGLEAEHFRSEPVYEMFQGKVAWEGVVQVFRVHGHPKARYAYAWSHETDAGGRRYVAVLGIPPATDPQNAVKVSIVAAAKKGKL